ncbi:MAG: protein kinase, partial [Anaerolineales bacterium]
MPRLQLNLLGSFRATLDGDPVTGFDSDKVRALLAYLAVETGRPHRREKLAGLLWPDYPERSARTSLRSALANLRAVIGDREAQPPYFNITRQTIQFNLQSDHLVDVAEFTRLVSGDSGDAERAVELYQGDFLEGFSIPDSASFEDWLVVTRGSLRRGAVRALLSLTRDYEAQGDHETALGYARRAGELEPYDEDAQRLIMRVLANSGRRTQAIASYEAFKGLLSDELGTEPSDVTQELAEQIDKGVYAAPAPGIGKLRGYELLELLGEGHFGAVHRAYQGAVGRDVAIKVILPRFANDPEFIRSFESEAQLVARLEHPHIVPLYDYWREPDGAYLVMRWLRGGSLKSALERGPWSRDAALQLVDQVASALAGAHRQGVVHRDIKPANILLDEVGNAYLSDFGIATLTGPLADRRGERSTETKRSASSMGYLSPELAAGAEPAPSADIYSFGVTIYELLIGKSPYPDLEDQALLEAHRTQELPSIVAQQPELPAKIDEVVRMATSKDPLQRYQDPMELAAAFRAALTGIAPIVEALPAEIANPYKGLRAFQETDARDFYGRERMVARLLERLSASPSAGEDRDGLQNRFLAVVGPSGSGKSSLVKAGLLPALRRGAVQGSQEWFLSEMTPGTRPFEELEAAILRVAVNPPEQLLGQLKEDDHGLARAVKRALPPGDATDLLLVVDQFEELFTLVGPSEARAFMDVLYAAVIDPKSRLRVVITLRADFYDRPLMIPDFSELVRECTEAVTPLSAEGLAQAIEEPARKVGVSFEEGLVARLVAEVHEQVGALPLLQYSLTELFERREGARLTAAAYEAMGGVSGALGRRAEQLFNELDDDGKAASRQVFLRLVTLGEGVEDTRRRVLRAELEALLGDQGLSPGDTQPSVEAGEAATGDAGSESPVYRPSSTVHHPSSTVHRPSSPVQNVLDLYGRHRLLTFDRDEESRAPTVEVAHEALLREWRRLAEWLEQSRADVRMQRVMGNLAVDWEASGRDPSFLLRGSRLDQYEAWAQVTDLALTVEEGAYLETSLTERRLREAEEAARQEHERALERRSIQRLRIIVAVLIVASVVGVILTLAIFNQSRIARQNEMLANQNAATATVAKGAAEFQAATAQAERVRAEGEADARATQQAIAESEADARATQQSIAEFNEAQARGQALAASSGVALNAGETDLALALALEAVNVDDPPLQAELALADAAYSPGTRHVLTGHLANIVYKLSLSPDARRALSGAIDRSVILWDLESGAPLQRYGGYRGSVSSVNYSPDGNTAVLGVLDGSVRLLDLETGNELGRFLHRPPFVPAEISPDGRRALWVDEAGRMVLLDLEEGVLIRAFGPAPDPDGDYSHSVSALAFHPDGIHALSGHVDGEVALWDLETGGKVRAFGEEPAAIEELLVTPDGSQFLSANASGEVVLWDVEAGQ